MIYRDLRDFIAQLEKMGELKRIAAEVARTTAGTTKVVTLFEYID